MIDTLTLDAEVQSILADEQYPHQERAVLATVAIETAVMAEFGIPFGKTLPIPAEWQHRVPLTDRTVREDTEVIEVRTFGGKVIHLDNTAPIHTVNPDAQAAADEFIAALDLDEERRQIEQRNAAVDAEMVKAREVVEFWGNEPEQPTLWQRFKARMREAR